MGMHNTSREPTCPLCSGRLEAELKVIVAASDGGDLRYRRAWVCRECSAAWPIAVKTEGVFGSRDTPLYHRGERAG